MQNYKRRAYSSSLKFPTIAFCLTNQRKVLCILSPVRRSLPGIAVVPPPVVPVPAVVIVAVRRRRGVAALGAYAPLRRGRRGPPATQGRRPNVGREEWWGWAARRAGEEDPWRSRWPRLVAQQGREEGQRGQVGGRADGIAVGGAGGGTVAVRVN